MKVLYRLRDVLISRILGLDDSPQRIARGVFLGFLVAMTPTLGLQIVIYVALATLLRVNKVAGVPILFITNPLTAVPLYGFCWWLGNVALHGGEGDASWTEVRARLMAESDANQSVYEQMFSADFWSRVGETMAQLGAELWFGSLLIGSALGVAGYGVSLWGVMAYRRHARALNIEPEEAVANLRNERSTPPPPSPR